jgi:hypothetical protein
MFFIKIFTAVLRQILFRCNKWFTPKKRKGARARLYSILFNYWIRFDYLREPDPDKRESLKALAMGGTSGRDRAKCYDDEPLDFNAKIGELSFNQAVPIFSEAEKILTNAPSGIVMIQIGSSSGREIAYFAGKYSRHTYFGTDVYQTVIDYSSQSHQSANLVFKRISAKDIGELLSEYTDRQALIFSHGSLQYVQPEHLSPFFAAIHRHGAAKILLCEPADDTSDKVPDLKGSTWRGNFSYTHNYRYHAEKEGIITTNCEIIKPYPDNPREAGNFFYYGEAPGK